MALPKLRSFKTDQRGFISVVALGIFALLVIVSLTVLEANVKTAESIKNSNKYYEAQDIAGSVMEYLQYTMKDKEAGFSIVKETCSYSDGEYVGDGGAGEKMLSFEDWIEKWCPEGNPPMDGGVYVVFECQQTLISNFNAECNPGGDEGTQCLQEWLQIHPQYDDDTDGDDNNPVETPKACNDVQKSLSTLIAGKNVEITVNIEGKSEEDDYFTDCFGILGNSTCYVVPIPGSGTAGENCAQYKSYEDGLGGQPGAKDMLNSIGKSMGEEGNTEFNIPRIDHPCNWNKLKLGSSSADRVSIPFYYQDEGGVVNPYNEEEQGWGDVGQYFVLRMRTPCKNGENSCTSNNRLWISGNSNTPVAQWQISGICGDEECGIIPNIDYKENLYMSAIMPERINDSLFDLGYTVLEIGSFGINTNTYIANTSIIGPLLSIMKIPTMTLFLGGAIKNSNELNIPYLEYQLLTDQQIGQPTTKMEVIVSVDGNTYKKVLYQQEQKPLVDFAIQN